MIRSHRVCRQEDLEVQSQPEVLSKLFQGHPELQETLSKKRKETKERGKGEREERSTLIIP